MNHSVEGLPTIGIIIAAVEEFAPLRLQEDYDNCGVQVSAGMDAACSGVMLALDPTPQVIAQAVDAGCNLVITHHPLLFKGLKSITGANPVERAVVEAICHRITVYSSHTALDRAAHGVSIALAAMLGVKDATPLLPDGSDADCGLGAVGTLEQTMPARDFALHVKRTLGCEYIRCSSTEDYDKPIGRVALCGGSGASLVGAAIRAGADALVTGDVSYHSFTDNAGSIFIVDAGHFNTEIITKNIFRSVIQQKFPTFAHLYTARESNPIKFL